MNTICAGIAQWQSGSLPVCVSGRLSVMNGADPVLGSNPRSPLHTKAEHRMQEGV